MDTRDKARAFAQSHYPFNLMNEWGDYIRPGSRASAWGPRATGVLFLLAALALAGLLLTK